MYAFCSLLAIVYYITQHRPANYMDHVLAMSKLHPTRPGHRSLLVALVELQKMVPLVKHSRIGARPDNAVVAADLSGKN
jgi:hypothetical protein